HAAVPRGGRLPAPWLSGNLAHRGERGHGWREGGNPLIRGIRGGRGAAPAAELPAAPPRLPPHGWGDVCRDAVRRGTCHRGHRDHRGGGWACHAAIARGGGRAAAATGCGRACSARGAGGTPPAVTQAVLVAVLPRRARARAAHRPPSGPAKGVLTWPRCEAA